MKNIIFIGASYSGKTTISKQLFKVLERYNYLSIDDEIEKSMNMSIKDIFEKYGEDEFRKIESACLASLKPNSSLIIDCGGGIVSSTHNKSIIKSLGTVVLLDRPSENICLDNKRPLIKNLQDLEALKKRRQKDYQECADIIITNHDMNKTINLLRKELNL